MFVFSDADLSFNSRLLLRVGFTQWTSGIKIPWILFHRQLWFWILYNYSRRLVLVWIVIRVTNQDNTLCNVLEVERIKESRTRRHNISQRERLASLLMKSKTRLILHELGDIFVMLHITFANCLRNFVYQRESRVMNTTNPCDTNCVKGNIKYVTLLSFRMQFVCVVTVKIPNW